MTIITKSLGCGLLLSVLTLGLANPARAQDEAEQQWRACTNNLSKIHDAIQAYRRAHRDLPNELSDLAGRFLSDPDVLVCPASKKRGATSAEIAGIAKYGLGDAISSYVYEFTTKPIPPVISSGSQRSMREWKRQAMGLIGSDVPMVRCHAHPKTINLSFGGAIYETDNDWERRFADVVRLDDLRTERLLSRPTIVHVVRIPERQADAPSSLVDLSKYYNLSLSDDWQNSGNGNNLATLPTGIQELGGVKFDVRGVVQLSDGLNAPSYYPPAVTNIAVGLRVKTLHFLHAARHAQVASGTRVGHYLIRYDDGQTREMPILYARHVLDWWSTPSKRFDPLQSKVAWEGSNAATSPNKKLVHLFMTHWTNPRPGSVITYIDFVSALTNCAPFVISISADIN